MTDDNKPREFKVQSKKIMCPDCSHVFTFESTFTSDAYASLQKENEELKKYRNNYDLQEENKSLRESLKLAVNRLNRVKNLFGEMQTDKLISDRIDETLDEIKATGGL